MADLLPWLRLLLARAPRLLLGVALMLATLLAGVGLLSLSGWFITATAMTALAWAAGIRATLDIYIPGGGIRFFALARTVSRYLERLYNHDTVLRLLADIRVMLFRSLIQLDCQAQSRYRASQWLNRLTRDINTLDNLYLRLLAPPIVMLLGVVAVAVFIGWLLPLAGWLAGLLLLLILLMSTLGMMFWGRALSQHQVDLADQLRVQSVEQLQGLAELSAWHVLPEHQERLMAKAREHSAGTFKLECKAALGQALVLAGVQAVVLLTLILGLLSYRNGGVTAPVLVMLPLSIMALSEGFAQLPRAFLYWGSVEAAAQRLNEQQSIQSRLFIPTTSKAIPPQASLELKNVGVKHQSNGGMVHVLNSLNMTLHHGEKLAIVGASGAGKSTLAGLAARLLDPTDGSVKFGATVLTGINPEHWRVHTAVLTQEAHLFNESLAYNLRIACPSATDEKLWKVLEQVALRETVSRFEYGLETQIGEFGAQLSGGEARRVALARIFLREPRLVILDEPLSGLDSPTAARVIANLNHFLSQRTALLLAHEVGALPRADRVLKLSGGQLQPVALE